MPALAFKIRARRSAGRRALTLIELLVVMVILSIVTAASIPMLSSGSESAAHPRGRPTGRQLYRRGQIAGDRNRPTRGRDDPATSLVKTMR